MSALKNINSIEDYGNFSKEAVKTYLDFVHAIFPDQLDIITILELLHFLHYEGKTLEAISTFESHLASMLYADLEKLNLDNDTKIFTCIILTTFDNYNDRYEQYVATKVTKEMLHKAILFGFFVNLRTFNISNTIQNSLERT